jgi:hypothetical protein
MTARAPVVAEGKDSAREPSSSPSPLTWLFGGVGAASLGLAVYLDLSVNAEADRLSASCGHACASDQVAPLHTKQYIALGAFGVGLVSLGVATYFFLTRPPSGDAHGHSVRHAPRPHTVGGTVDVR